MKAHDTAAAIALIAVTFLACEPASLFSQSPASLIGTVHTSDGSPVVGVRVTAKPDGPEGTGLPSLVTQTDGKGEYRFEDIRPGSYAVGVSVGPDGSHLISTPALFAMGVFVDIFNLSRGATASPPKLVLKPVLRLPPSVTVNGAVAAWCDLLVLPFAVTVRGRLSVVPAIPPPSSLKISLDGITLSLMADTEIRPDGTFEFPVIPPGSYTLRLRPSLGIPPATITVSDQNLNDVEFGSTRDGRRVSGSLLPSDRGAYQGMFPEWVFLIRRDIVGYDGSSNGKIFGEAGTDSPSDTLSSPRPVGYTSTGDGFESPVAQVGMGGRFEFLAVPPGEYYVRTTPDVGLANTSITVADSDVAGVRVGLGVRVRGEVVASNFGTRGPRVITLSFGPKGPTVSTGVDADGTFEFPQVGMGTYRISLDSKTRPSPTEITVGNEEIVFRVETPFQPEVSGRFIFEGDRPVPENIGNTHVSLSSGFDSPVNKDGSFKLQSYEGEYELFVRNLPEGYFVKSMYQGSTSLLAGPLKVDGSAPPVEVFVTVEYRTEVEKPREEPTIEAR
jgi:hypothetical protein